MMIICKGKLNPKKPKTEWINKRIYNHMHNKNIKLKIGHNKQKMEKRLSWVLFNKEFFQKLRLNWNQAQNPSFPH